jgi:phosphoenolpyruvate carboxylase
LKDSFECFRQNSQSLILVDQMPFLKPFYYNKFNKAYKTLGKLSNKISQKYVDHLKDKEDGVIRDICDGLIEAKEEAIKEQKESAQDLVDRNLSLVIFDLFIGL